MVPLKWVDATDIFKWADRLEARARLPQLLRLLIHATVQQPRRVNFPSGESIQMGGWDGIVDAPLGNRFVPNGYSVWELGVNQDVKGKADDDYDKRVKNPLGVFPAETTFVFITPRRWGNKNKWEMDKKSEGIWADVRAYDADDLEQWLELAPAVHAWLARSMGKWIEEAQDISSFWDEWKTSTSPALSTHLHLTDREKEVEKVHNWLQVEPSKLTIQADTREEVIAFLAAVVHQMPEIQSVNYLSRCIIVQSQSSWRYFANTQESLILIPAFEQLKFLPTGHHILIPIGREIRPAQDVLMLPRPAKTGFRQALIDMGLSEEQACNLIKKSRRNFNILRRLIAVAPELHFPDWAKPKNGRSLIPVLLAGAWDDRKEGDRDAIAKLACKPYAEVIADISRWVKSSDPPVRQVGSIWQLISREDSWYLLSRFISRDDLEAFESTTLSILGTPDPQYELPLDKRFAASMYGNSLPYSGFIRKGLAETLAVLATQGLLSDTQDIIPAQERVTAIVYQLLNFHADWQIWASLAYFLPTLAEAAPEAFLEAVDDGLTGDNPIIVQLFLQEEPFGRSPHPGLLWALEVLVWEAQYLSQVTLILGKLSRLDPGGKISNRPFASLVEIFLCWNPQTTATLAQRLRVLDTLIVREPDIAWQLLHKLLPKLGSSSSSPTYKPRWREWNIDCVPRVSVAEYWNNVSAVIKLILLNTGTDIKKLCDVIKKIESFTPKLQNQSISYLLSVDCANIQPQNLAIICTTLREVIYKHKEFPNAEWVLPAATIDRFYLLYEKFEPKDPIHSYAWLFSLNPNLINCINRDWETKNSEREQARTEAVMTIYSQNDINIFLEMAEFVKEPSLLGFTITSIEKISGEVEIKLLTKALGSDSKRLNALAEGFIRRQLEKLGWNWAETILYLAKNESWSTQQVIKFFYALPFSKLTWNILVSFGEELINLYWQTISASLFEDDDRETAILNLLKINRPYAAMNLVILHRNDKDKCLPPMLLVNILEKAASVDPQEEKPRPNTNNITYRIEQIFNILESSDEIEDNKLAYLEWLYLSLLINSPRQPKLLYQELFNDPLSFVKIIEFVYKSENHKDESIEIDKISLNRAERGYKLLKSWHQVPGLKEDKTIDLEQLRGWVLQARRASYAIGRGKIADKEIGHVLAHAPKSPEYIPLWQIYLFCLAIKSKLYSLIRYLSFQFEFSQSSDGIWPAIAVREIIEEIESKDMEKGIVSGVFEKRGVWIKSIGEGGIQETHLAETYQYYAIFVGDIYPRTAALLRSIAEGYKSAAYKENIRAELED